MSTMTTGVVTNGVVVPTTPLPEGARVHVVVVPAAPAQGALRGVPAESLFGIAAGDGAPPDDETVKRWLEEYRLEKHG